jgi:hypothetical protein
MLLLCLLLLNSLLPVVLLPLLHRKLVPRFILLCLPLLLLLQLTLPCHSCWLHSLRFASRRPLHGPVQNRQSVCTSGPGHGTVDMLNVCRRRLWRGVHLPWCLQRGSWRDARTRGHRLLWLRWGHGSVCLRSLPQPPPAPVYSGLGAAAATPATRSTAPTAVIAGGPLGCAGGSCARGANALAGRSHACTAAERGVAAPLPATCPSGGVVQRAAFLQQAAPASPAARQPGAAAMRCNWLNLQASSQARQRPAACAAAPGPGQMCSRGKVCGSVQADASTATRRQARPAGGWGAAAPRPRRRPVQPAAHAREDRRARQAPAPWLGGAPRAAAARRHARLHLLLHAR